MEASLRFLGYERDGNAGELGGENTGELDALPECGEDGESLVASKAVGPRAEPAGGAGGARGKRGGCVAELGGRERGRRAARQAVRQGVGVEVVGMVGKRSACPVFVPSLGVLRDDVVGASRDGLAIAALYDGGLPGFAAANVRVSSAAFPRGGVGGPGAPTVAGVAESSEGVGGGCSSLLIVVGEAPAKVGREQGSSCRGPGRQRLGICGAKAQRGRRRKLECGGRRCSGCERL